MHAAPAVACVKPLPHVHRPVPPNPLEHDPPIPHAHAVQYVPNVPDGHDVQYVPFGERPAGHVPTHVALLGTRYCVLGQVTHAVAFVTQVAQFALHDVHTLAGLAYVPFGQPATHVPPLKYGSEEPALQLVQAPAPLARHVAHVASQPAQLWPFE